MMIHDETMMKHDGHMIKNDEILRTSRTRHRRFNQHQSPEFALSKPLEHQEVAEGFATTQCSAALVLLSTNSCCNMV